MIVQKCNVINLEHDLCLASGERNFIPPRAVMEFARRCRWIGRFMRAPEGDCRRIVPWGWDIQLKERLLKEGVPAEELPSDGELEFIKVNSRRELAVELLEYIVKDAPGGVPVTEDGHAGVAGESRMFTAVSHIVRPDYRIVAHSLPQIEAFLQENGRVVLKAPLSGSGKGVRFVAGELMETDRGWCRRILESQGVVIVEQRLDVVQEFAMLFEVAASGTKFLGYSVFYASNGAYKGNLLASNGFLEDKLAGIVGKVTLEGPVRNGDSEVCVARKTLAEIQEKVAGFLQEKLGGRYTGFVGVDMFLYNDVEGRILLNPAVEINLRMTMGLVARNIYDHYREEFQIGDGTHCFEPGKGVFPVAGQDL